MQKDSRKFGTLYYSLYLCRRGRDGGDRVRGGNGGIKNLQYKPTRAFADKISKCPCCD